MENRLSQPHQTLLIEYYTDPFSCWSWCNEPKVRKLQLEFGNQLEWRFVMGGLLDASGADNPALMQERVAEIIDDWQMLQHEQGMPLVPDLWHKNPPKTTLVACKAVKAAAKQGSNTEQAVLRRLREAAMTETNPLDEPSLIFDLVKALPVLDLSQFRRDFSSPGIEQALAQDLHRTRNPLFQAEEVKETVDGKMRYAFPTTIFHYGDETRIIGPSAAYDKYIRELQDLNPELERFPIPPLETLLQQYPSMTTREIEVIYNWSHAQALEQLESLWEERKIQKHPVGGDFFWISSSLVAV